MPGLRFTAWRLRLGVIAVRDRGELLSSFTRQPAVDQPLRERLEPLLGGSAFTPRVRTGGKAVVELDDGWYLEPQRELISNAKLRIDETLQTEDDRVFYRGHVRFGGEDVPFTENATVIERDAFTWMKRLLLKTGKGIPACQPSWSRRALSLALQFHSPIHASGVDRVGWSRQRLRFEFPRFAIHLGGSIDSNHRLLPIDDLPPATDLREPESLSRKDCEAIGVETHETAVFWAMVACVVNNLAGRAMRYQPSGIALAGPAAQATGRAAARLLGCTELRMPQRLQVDALLEKLHVACRRHDWPLIFIAPDRQPAWVRRAWLEDAEPKNCILAVQTYAAEVLAIQRGWNVIRCGREASGLQQLRRSGLKVLSAYIQDLTCRKLNYITPGTCRTVNFLHDLAAWFERAGGNPQAVTGGMRVLVGDGQQPAWWSFAEIVSQLMLDGVVEYAFVPPALTEAAVVDVTLDDADRGPLSASWIPQRPIACLVQAQCGLMLDVGAVTSSLEADGLLLAERPYRGVMGWVVDRQRWWERMDCCPAEARRRDYLQPEHDLDRRYRPE